MEVIIEIKSHPEGAPRSFTILLSTENSSAGMHITYISVLHFYSYVGEDTQVTSSVAHSVI